MGARSAAAGFTYLEVLMAAALLATTMTMIGYALAHSRHMQSEQELLQHGRYLLHDGVTWVRLLARYDADEPDSWGFETGESTLADVDDVDDLDGLVELGPTDRAGDAASKDWQRAWTVRTADLATPTADAAKGSTPLMRVTVAVTYQGREITRDTLLLSRTP